MNALRAGLGIGGMQWGLARRAPELQAVLPQALRFDLDMWLVMHEDLRRLPAAQALFKHLSAELSAYAASCIAPL
jgi:DNA-binding transcriptional LysR family regulator